MPLYRGSRRLILRRNIPVVASALPVATFKSGLTMTGTGITQTASVNLGAGGGQQYVIIGLYGAGIGNTIASVNVAPNVGTAVNLTSRVVDGVNRTAIFADALLTDANSATTATVTVTMNSNPSQGTGIVLWTVPFANLSSGTPVGTNSVATASVLTVSTTVATTSGGFVIAVGSVSGNETTLVFSGTESYTTDSTVLTSIVGGGGSANGVATNASSTVTMTVTAVANTLRLSTASWR